MDHKTHFDLYCAHFNFATFWSIAIYSESDGEIEALGDICNREMTLLKRRLHNLVLLKKTGRNILRLFKHLPRPR